MVQVIIQKTSTMERKINGVLTEFEGEVDRFLLSLGTNRVRGNVNKLLLLNAQLQEAQVCVVGHC